MYFRTKLGLRLGKSSDRTIVFSKNPVHTRTEQQTVDNDSENHHGRGGIGIIITIGELEGGLTNWRVRLKSLVLPLNKVSLMTKGPKERNGKGQKKFNRVTIERMR